MILLLLLTLFTREPAAGAGGGQPLCANRAPVVVKEGGKFGIGFCTSLDVAAPTEVVIEGHPQIVISGVMGQDQGLFYHETPRIFTAPPGTTPIVVRVQDPETGEWSSYSLPLNLTTDQDPCAAPFGVEAISLFVTRWSVPSKVIGSPMRLDYRVVSRSPIVEVQAKVNNTLVGTPLKGADLGESAGIWFPAPPPGSYKLSISAKNTYGCGREVFSPIDLMIK